MDNQNQNAGDQKQESGNPQQGGTQRPDQNPDPERGASDKQNWNAPSPGERGNQQGGGQEGAGQQGGGQQGGNQNR